LPLAAKKGRHPVLDAGGDQHARVAEADEAAPLGMTGEAGFEPQFAHLVGRAAAGAHEILLIDVSRP